LLQPDDGGNHAAITQQSISHSSYFLLQPL
jgi:hypothetical protein